MAEDEFELDEEQEAAVAEALKRHAPPQREARIKPATPDAKELRAKRETYATLIILALLIGSIYVFWILPNQLGSSPVKVDFGKKK